MHDYIGWHPEERDNDKILDILNSLIKQSRGFKASKQIITHTVEMYKAVAVEGMLEVGCRDQIRGFFAGMLSADLDALGNFFDDETVDYIAKITFGKIL